MLFPGTPCFGPETGLTARELIAALELQGLLAGGIPPRLTDPRAAAESLDEWLDARVRLAIRAADRLTDRPAQQRHHGAIHQ